MPAPPHRTIGREHDLAAVGERLRSASGVILGGGKALFDGFTKSLDLEHIGARQLEWATLIEYPVKN